MNISKGGSAQKLAVPPQHIKQTRNISSNKKILNLSSLITCQLREKDPYVKIRSLRNQKSERECKLQRPPHERSCLKTSYTTFQLRMQKHEEIDVIIIGIRSSFFRYIFFLLPNFDDAEVVCRNGKWLCRCKLYRVTPRRRTAEYAHDDVTFMHYHITYGARQTWRARKNIHLIKLHRF